MKSSRNGRAVRRTSHKKRLIGLIAAAVAVCVAVGGTIAYLFAVTQPITNTFQMSTVDIEIEDNVDNGIKTNVGVKNSSDEGVPIYARIRFVTYWENDKGEIVASDEQPPLPFEAETVPANPENNDWFEYDGYYYYKYPITADTSSKYLIESFKLAVDEEKGLHQVLEVLAEGIQSMPEDAVGTAWGLAVDSDGNLTSDPYLAN